MRCILTALAYGCVMTAVALADDTAADLGPRLAPHVGAVIDLVELGTGKRFVRPTLVGVTERKGAVAALRLTAEGETRTVSVPLAGVAKIVAGRETIF